MNELINNSRFSVQNITVDFSELFLYSLFENGRGLRVRMFLFVFLTVRVIDNFDRGENILARRIPYSAKLHDYQNFK